MGLKWSQFNCPLTSLMRHWCFSLCCVDRHGSVDGIYIPHDPSLSLSLSLSLSIYLSIYLLAFCFSSQKVRKIAGWGHWSAGRQAVTWKGSHWLYIHQVCNLYRLLYTLVSTISVLVFVTLHCGILKLAQCHVFWGSFQVTWVPDATWKWTLDPWKNAAHMQFSSLLLVGMGQHGLTIHFITKLFFSN